MQGLMEVAAIRLRNRRRQNMKKNLYRILLAFFAIIFVVSCTFLVRELVIRRKAINYMDELQASYKPELPAKENTSVETVKPDDTAVSSEDTGNPTIQTLVSEYPDAIGWLTVEGAEISHPFVIGDDNAEYIRADLDGSYIISGSLFMDYRNSRDMSDGLSVIYGHNMKDKTMFGKLSNYCDDAFLKDNPDVYVSLPDSTLHYTAFACMIVDAADSPIYENFGRRDNIQDIVDYVLKNADYLNSDINVDGSDKLLVLSTCNPQYFTARAVLVCVLDTSGTAGK